MTTQTDYAKLRAELDKVQVAMRGAKCPETYAQLREVSRALNLALAKVNARKETR